MYWLELPVAIVSMTYGHVSPFKKKPQYYLQAIYFALFFIKFGGFVSLQIHAFFLF